jgi:hypothetical protein
MSTHFNVQFNTLGGGIGVKVNMELIEGLWGSTEHFNC